MVVRVIELLLILSGDIETNPGPVWQLTLEDLSEVVQALYDARAKWYRIGLQLKLSVGTLNAIRSEFSNATDRLTEMCSHWLRRIDPRPSWSALTKVLESPPVGEEHLAQQLRDKYCRGREEMIPHFDPTPGPSPPGAPPTTQGPPSSLITDPPSSLITDPPETHPISQPGFVTTPPLQPGPGAPVRHHQPSHEATPEEGTAAMYPNAVHSLYSQNIHLSNNTHTCSHIQILELQLPTQWTTPVLLLISQTSPKCILTKIPVQLMSLHNTIQVIVHNCLPHTHQSHFQSLLHSSVHPSLCTMLCIHDEHDEL